MHAVESERDARDVAEHRAAEERQKPTQAKPKLSLEELFGAGDGDGPKELRIVLKADVHGSVEAVRDALLKLATETVKVNVILAGVGAISESDVMLAKASDAIVVGFHVRPDPAARRAAEGQGVDLRSYQIIYELTDEVRKAMAGLLPPKIEEKVLGRIEVRKTFNVPRIGTIAGSLRPRGHGAPQRAGAPAARRRAGLGGRLRLAQALQGRRPRGADRLRVRHRTRRLQRRQGRRRHRALRDRGDARRLA